MNTNPINLGIRFVLEMAMLISLGCWGWHLSGLWIKYIAVVCLPLTAAILWGFFRIQNDPKPAPVEIPGIFRLLLELGLFAFAAWALYNIGFIKLGMIMTVVTILHYLASYDRTWAMLRNKPYNGFMR